MTEKRARSVNTGDIYVSRWGIWQGSEGCIGARGVVGEENDNPETMNGEEELVLHNLFS